MGLLVGAMDIATANNTVAIVISNPIAAEDVRHLEAQDGIAFGHVLVRFPRHPALRRPDRGHLGRHGASWLVSRSDHPVLFYPFLLLIGSLVFIFIVPDKS